MICIEFFCAIGFGFVLIAFVLNWFTKRGNVFWCSRHVPWLTVGDLVRQSRSKKRDDLRSKFQVQNQL
jgi:hypothetical protein